MRARKVKTEIRQEQIAQAALGLITRGGMTAVSVAEVARHVGVVPSAIYRHYRGKDELLDVVLDLIGQRLLGNVQAVRAKCSDPLERLHSLFLRHLEMVRSDAGIPRVVLSEEIFAGQPRRRNKMHGIIRSYLNEVALLFREGQTSGRFHANVEPDAVALMFLGMIQPAVMLWVMSGGKFDIDEHAVRAWQLFEQALQPVLVDNDDPTHPGARKESAKSDH